MNKRCSRRSRHAIAILISALALALLIPLPAQAHEHPRVLVLISSGLSWSDIDPDQEDNRQLMKTVSQAGVGNLTRQGVAKNTCPLDGYLTLSAGRRITALNSRTADGCPSVPIPRSGHFPVAELKSWKKDAQNQHGRSSLGLLGESLEKGNNKVVAIGPGAGLAAMDSSGKIANYRERSTGEHLTAQIKTALRQYEVTIVDVGSTSSNQDTLEQPASISAPSTWFPDKDLTLKPRLGKVKNNLQSALAATDANTIVFGIDVADHSSDPHLGMAFWKSASAKPGFLRSTGIRQQGLVSTADFSREIIATTGSELSEQLAGGKLLIQSSENGSTNLNWLRNQSLRAEQVGLVQMPFYLFCALCFFIALAYFVRRLRHPYSSLSGRALNLVTWGLLFVPLLGPASVIALLLPPSWYGAAGGNLTSNQLEMSHALLNTEFILVSGIISALLALLCQLLGILLGKRYPRYQAAMPAILCASVFILWILGSVLSGSPDQVSAVFSAPATRSVRFYGVNNNKYAFLFTATIILESLLLAPAAKKHPERTNRYFAYAFLALAVVVIIDGLPYLGADVGGPLAMIIGVGVTVNLVLGRAIRPWKIIVLTLVAAASSTIFAIVDLVTPTYSTHFGRFLYEVFRRQGGVIVERKARAMIDSFGGPVGLVLVLLAVALVAYLVIAKKKHKTIFSFGSRVQSTGKTSAFLLVPGIKEIFIGVITTALLGALLNDSGSFVLISALFLAIPTVSAALTQASVSGCSEDLMRQKPRK